MEKIVFTIFLTFAFYGCGKLEEAKKTVADFSNSLIPQLPPSTATNQGPYTPGSYFLILRDYGQKKDIRIFDFQYLADKTFLLKQINFSGGNLSDGSYQKKTGTISEDNQGTISHSVNYDSCNNNSSTTITLSGNPKDKVNASYNGLRFSLFSYSKWMLPTEISSKLDNLPEDIGCKKF
jgi:hypothetical protein